MTENYIWGLGLLTLFALGALLLAIFGGVDRSGEKHRKH